MTLLQGQFWTPRPLCRAWGQRQLFHVPNPAAGADWVWKPRPGFVHVPIAIHAELVIGVGAGERYTILELTDGDGNPLIETAGLEAPGAGTTARYTWYGQQPLWSAVKAHRLYASLPAELLPQGYQIRTTTVTLGAEDQWSKITVWADEFEINPEHDYAVYHDLHERVEHIERRMMHHGAPQYHE